jgi:hypothetical protein
MLARLVMCLRNSGHRDKSDRVAEKQVSYMAPLGGQVFQRRDRTLANMEIHREIQRSGRLDLTGSRRDA